MGRLSFMNHWGHNHFILIGCEWGRFDFKLGPTYLELCLLNFGVRIHGGK